MELVIVNRWSSEEAWTVYCQVLLLLYSMSSCIVLCLILTPYKGRTCISVVKACILDLSNRGHNI